MFNTILDNKDAIIEQNPKTEFDITCFNLKGSVLEIEGYSSVVGINTSEEENIRRVLYLRSLADVKELREKYEEKHKTFMDEFEDNEITDEELIEQQSYLIPLENCKLSEIISSEIDNLDKQNSLTGFRLKLDLSTLDNNKPLEEDEYSLYIVHEQIDSENENIRYIKTLPLAKAKGHLNNGLLTANLNYFSAKLIKKYKVIFEFDALRKTLKLTNTLLQSYNPEEFELNGIVKEHRIISSIKRKFFKLCYILLSILPINKKKISIASDSRQELSGNLFYVYEEMYKQELDVKPVLLLSERIDNKKTFFQMIKLAYHFSTSKIILIDDFYPLIYSLNLRKRTELVQVWHAAGAFKTFGFSRLGRPGGPSIKSPNHRNYTKALVSSEGVRSHYAEGFGIDLDKVISTGVPRADMFFDEEYKRHVKERLFNEYPMLKNKKVILFAPTFRGNGQASAHYPFEALDLRTLYENLADEYVFIFKIHPFVQNEFHIPYDMSEFFYDFSDFREINDLLLVTDILITDYSSVCFEFGILNKPMLFFAFDVEEYIKERDFYYDYFEFIPGPLVKNSEEIVHRIKTKQFEMEKIPPFIDYFFKDTLGNASSTVVNEVIKPILLDENIEEEVKVRLTPPKSRIELFERTLNEREDEKF